MDHGHGGHQHDHGSGSAHVHGEHCNHDHSGHQHSGHGGHSHGAHNHGHPSSLADFPGVLSHTMPNGKPAEKSLDAKLYQGPAPMSGMSANQQVMLPNGQQMSVAQFQQMQQMMMMQQMGGQMGGMEAGMMPGMMQQGGFSRPSPQDMLELPAPPCIMGQCCGAAFVGIVLFASTALFLKLNGGTTDSVFPMFLGSLGIFAVIMCFGSSKHVCVPTNHAPVVAGAVMCGVAGYQAYLNTIGSETTGFIGTGVFAAAFATLVVSVYRFKGWWREVMFESAFKAQNTQKQATELHNLNCKIKAVPICSKIGDTADSCGLGRVNAARICFGLMALAFSYTLYILWTTKDFVPPEEAAGEVN